MTTQQALTLQTIKDHLAKTGTDSFLYYREKGRVVGILTPDGSVLTTLTGHNIRASLNGLLISGAMQVVEQNQDGEWIRRLA